VSILHPRAITAAECADSALIATKDFAKTVMVKIDGTMAMVVLPADRWIVLSELRDMLASDNVELATESEFASRFPDCEIGAMPPFGNLYGLPVFIAKSFTDELAIGFNAGTHREVIKMNFDDYEELVRPTVLDFAMA
jgi:Ala-tRNA(Pro) deacylase